MILNKNGWGLREMLFICAILLFCVILVAVMINYLYEGITSNGTSTTTNSYTQDEKNLKIAAERYYRKLDDENVNLIVSEDLFAEEYLTEEKMTVDNDVCTGYVLIEENTFTPYITCDNYETEGY